MTSDTYNADMFHGGPPGGGCPIHSALWHSLGPFGLCHAALVERVI